MGSPANRLMAASPPPKPISRIDKSLLTLPLPRRLRDKPHLQFVAKQPCLVCGRQPCDAHHLHFAQLRSLGLKVSQQFSRTLRLCRVHHRELHQSGKEVEWWARKSIEPIGIARQFWLETHPLQDPVRSSRTGATGNRTLRADNNRAIASLQPAPRMPMARKTQLPDLPT